MEEREETAPGDVIGGGTLHTDRMTAGVGEDSGVADLDDLESREGEVIGGDGEWVFAAATDRAVVLVGVAFRAAGVCVGKRLSSVGSSSEGSCRSNEGEGRTNWVGSGAVSAGG